eukprot:s1011_g8.t1
MVQGSWRSKESPFGAFPSEYVRPSNLGLLGSSVLSSASTPSLGLRTKALPKPLKKGTGTGGAVSSLAVRKCPAPAPPPKAGAWVPRPATVSEFRRAYDRGDVPVQISYEGVSKSLTWKAPLEKLDYIHFMPLFFDGLKEKQDRSKPLEAKSTKSQLADPYGFLSTHGIHSLLDHGGSRITSTIPQLILPIKAALNTRDTDIVARTLQVLQKLITSAPGVGQALVPYYRQLLPIFNLYKDSTTGTDAAMDYGQRRRRNLGELVEETLELLEVSWRRGCLHQHQVHDSNVPELWSCCAK